MTWLTRFLVALALCAELFTAAPAKAEPNLLANRGQVDLVVAGEMNPAEHTALHQAAQVWNTLVGRPVLLLVDHEPAGTHDAVFYVVSVLGYDDPGTLAVTYRAYDKAYLSYLEFLRAKPVILRRVLIHELGHVLGLDHSEDRASVMYPEIGEADAPTVPEVLYLRSLWVF